jgi:hypothetical protein
VPGLRGCGLGAHAVTPREAFLAELVATVECYQQPMPTPEGPAMRPACLSVDRIQALIDARVDAALRDHLDCVPIAEHWRESDTHELRTGFGDDVGECDSGCPVDALDRAGLIVVRVVPKCAAGHEWYGEGCEDCARVEKSEAPA